MNFRYALQDAWRYVPDPDLSLRHGLWDVALGLVAVLLAWLFTASLDWTSGWRRGLRWLMGSLWLIFLPNAAYLVTEVRSIPDVTHSVAMAWVHHEIDGGRRTTACLVWVFFYMGLALAGIALYGAALYPVQRRCVADRRSGALLCILISLASAIGVDLGLSRRFNSWDLVWRPGAIFHAATDRLSQPGVETLFVVTFTALLALIWILTWIFGKGWVSLYGGKPMATAPEPSP